MEKNYVVFYLLTLCFAAKSQAPQISYTNPPVYTAGITIAPLTPANAGGEVPATILGEVTTFAGTTKGYINGPKNEAKFEFPDDLAHDAANNIYVSDYGNDVIRKISADGIVTTLAGSSNIGSDNGTGTEASFYNPSGIVVDRSGNVYVADSYNNMIRKITPDGVVTTFAGSKNAGKNDGLGSEARFNRPEGLDIDSLGNIYVADYANHMIRKVTPEGVVTTIAGTGTRGYTNGNGPEAQFNFPKGVAVDKHGNLFVADYGNDVIRKISPEHMVTSVYGTTYPYALAFDTLGNLYVCDLNSSLLKITPEGIKSRILANGGGNGLEVDADGIIYVANGGNHVIRKITQYGYSINSKLPLGLSFDGKTGTISGTPETGSTNTDYTITAKNSSGSSTAKIFISIIGPPVLSTQSVSNIGNHTATANGTVVNMGIPNPTQYGVVWSKEKNPVIENSNKTEQGIVSNTGAFTSTMSGLDSNTKYYVRSYALNDQGVGYGNEVYFYTKNIAPVIEYLSPEGYIKGVSIQPVSPISNDAQVTTYLKCYVSTYAGTGEKGFYVSSSLLPTMSVFDNPTNTAVDNSGHVYFVDCGNAAIHRINVNNVANIVGTAFEEAGIRISDAGITIDSQNTMYIADSYRQCIYKLIPGSNAVLLAGGVYTGSNDGTGTSASFNHPCGIAVDNSGILYIADRDNHMIRKVTQEGVVSKFAGSTSAGFADGLSSKAKFNSPNAVAIDANGNLYVADRKNNMIRKIFPDGDVITFAGNINAGFVDGKGTSASFNSPTGIAVDQAGYVYVADFGNNSIRKISPEGDVKTIAGNSIPGSLDDYSTEATFNGPYGISVDKFGNLFVADRYNNKIRKITQYKYSISPSLPAGLYFDDATGMISGTPTVVSNSTKYVVWATNSGGTDSAAIFLSVKEVLNLTTDLVYGIGQTSAGVKGYLGYTENTEITQYGFVWDTIPNPSIDLPSKVELGANPTEGLFISDITGLKPYRKYYLRSYATCSLGTVYGNSLSFYTQTLVSVNDISDESFEIYPNPTVDYITVKCLAGKIENIELFDLTGKPQSNIRIENDRINFGDLTPGMYILRINHSTFKIIKKPR